MRPLMLLASALFLIPLVPFSAAGPCDHAPNSLGIIAIDAGARKFYVDDRGTQNSVWFYEETNGVNAAGAAGLQRGGSYTRANITVTDPCLDDEFILPDTLLL